MDWKNFGLRVWRIVKNRYVATSLIFLLLFFFLDNNNIFVISRLQKEVNRLTDESQEARMLITADSIHAVNLVYNLDTIERYAREEYLMKRPDEDVFVFSD